jgi:hypothetical protein
MADFKSQPNEVRDLQRGIAGRHAMIVVVVLPRAITGYPGSAGLIACAIDGGGWSDPR